MINTDKFNSAKIWIEKLANGINPLTDELVKDDDLINNVHISRCLFYVSELLDEIKARTSAERKNRKAFFLSTEDAKNISITTPTGIANFTKLVNSYIPSEMKPLSAALVTKWLRNKGLMQKVTKDDGHTINLPTEKGNSIGITTEVQRNPEGMEYQRVVYSIDAQRFMLNNIEAITGLQ
ncbi:MAG: hypothetical protein Q4A15_05500 [Prevotellaceae bacterium]|nr:hypothetical protein [Prevotellaceae bacterium]